MNKALLELLIKDIQIAKHRLELVELVLQEALSKQTQVNLDPGSVLFVEKWEPVECKECIENYPFYCDKHFGERGI